MRESEAESEEPLHLPLPFSKSLPGKTLDSIAHGMRNEITASERRDSGSFSIESRSFCVILRGVIVPEPRPVVTDRVEQQNDRRAL